MAVSVGQIALDIVMGKNTVSSVVKSAMSECRKVMSDSSAAIGTKVQSIGNACTSIGASMLPVSTAMSAVGKGTVKTAADFESAMSEVSAISGATGEDFDQLKAKAKEMGEKTKFSASESAEAMKYMAMAGWKTSDMLDGISGIMDLAAASGEDLATTSDIVTDALTAFGMSAGDSGHFADVLAAASSNANTNVSMMGETFKYVAPVAGALGFTAEDTSVAIGLMANSGIKASQAGTSLRSIISRMASPTKESAEAMEKLGISIKNSDGTMKSFREIMQDMRRGFAGLTEDEKANYAAMLGEKDAMSGLLAIVNSSDADFNKLTGAIDNCNGTASRMAETMNNNLNGRLTLLKSKLEGVAIEIGQSLVPIIDAAINVVSKFADWFSNLSEGGKQVVVTIGVIVAAFAPFMLIMGKVIGVVGSLVNGVAGFIGFIQATVIPALGTFFSFIAANPIVLVIGLVIAAGVALVSNWQYVKELAITIWQAIADFFVGLWNGIRDFFVGIWTGIRDFFVGIWNGIYSFISGVLGGIWNVISAVFGGIFGTIKTILGGIWSFISGIWNTISGFIGGVVGGIWNVIKTVFGGIFGTIKSIFTGVWSFISGIWNTITGFIGGVVKGIWNTITSVFGNIFSGISGTMGNIKNAIVDGFNGAISFITSLPSKAIQWGKDFIGGLINGIKSMIGGIVDAVKGIGEKIKSFLHFSVPDEGPLTDYESWMPDFMQGLANGIKANTGLVTGALSDLTADMTVTPTISAPSIKSAGTVRAGGVSSGDKLDELIKAFKEYTAAVNNQKVEVTSPIYIGGEYIDDYITESNNRRTIRSGGRA